jgi:pimeloyl-ACP methyl ester carboxylesterase
LATQREDDQRYVQRLISHLALGPSGNGTTRFLSSARFRNGQPSAVALDIIALMEALKIEKAIIGGFDWGARTTNILAALWPARSKALVSVSGYLIGNRESNKKPLPPKAELEWRYQFYFATERGNLGKDFDSHDLLASSQRIHFFINPQRVLDAPKNAHAESS